VLEASGLIFRPLWYKPQARRWRNTPLYPGRGDIVYALARLSPFDSFMSYIWKISGECRRFSQAPLPARCRKASL